MWTVRVDEPTIEPLVDWLERFSVLPNHVHPPVVIDMEEDRLGRVEKERAVRGTGRDRQL
jgi:hypothetical protein